MLLNRNRAYEVMDRHGLDGLIAVTRQNIYYLSDVWSHTLTVERSFHTFAVLPRAEDAPAAFIGGLVESGRIQTWMPNVISVSGRASPTAANVGATQTDPLDPFGIYVVGKDSVLTSSEQKWIDIALERKNQLVTTHIEGLKRALIDAGLDRGCLGSDDPRVINWLTSMGLEHLTGLDSTNIFREIRMVKSEDEISLLRKAGQKNEVAVEATIAAIQEGTTTEELQRVYFTEMAAQGAKGSFILFGTVPGMRHGLVVKGEPFLLDALGVYGHYHGDLGRTMIVGQPDSKVKKRNQAMQAGWSRACEMIKPGTKASNIVHAVMETMRKEGFPEFNHCVAHTLGLEHTDHPIPIGPNDLNKITDFTLESNMVLNFDMPYQEFGWGSMHLEDTVQVVSDGFKPLTSMQTELRIL